MLDDEVACGISAQVRQRTGDHERLARQGLRRRRGTLLRRHHAHVLQLRDERPVFVLREKRPDGARDLGSDAVDLRERLFRRISDGVQIAEVAGQELRHALAHHADTERVHEPREPALTGAGDRADHVLRGLLRHPLELRELVDGQAIQVRERTNQPALDQLLR